MDTAKSSVTAYCKVTKKFHNDTFGKKNIFLSFKVKRTSSRRETHFSIKKMISFTIHACDDDVLTTDITSYKQKNSSQPNDQLHGKEDFSSSPFFHLLDPFLLTTCLIRLINKKDCECGTSNLHSHLTMCLLTRFDNYLHLLGGWY